MFPQCLVRHWLAFLNQVLTSIQFAELWKKKLSTILYFRKKSHSFKNLTKKTLSNNILENCFFISFGTWAKKLVLLSFGGRGGGKVCTFLQGEALTAWHDVQCTQREIASESCQIEPNLYCNYTFPIDLTSNGIPFGANLIKKGNSNPNLVRFNKIQGKFLCTYGYILTVSGKRTNFLCCCNH